MFKDTVSNNDEKPAQDSEVVSAGSFAESILENAKQIKHNLEQLQRLVHCKKMML